MNEPVLVSLCFYGVPCRYHGKSVPSPAKIRRLSARYVLIPVCPERAGGLPCPRAPAPLGRRNGDTLLDIDGNDVGPMMQLGANRTLVLAQALKIRKAYLCKHSPSCDKTGFTGELLLSHGIRVINL